jgi:8-oxo-dGTP diphosphatase
MTPVSHDSETAAHGKQVITACALIHKNFDGVEKVFLPKRAETKKFLPGVFELPGGHIDFAEDIVQGLKREIREELDMEVVVGDPFAVFTYTNEVKGSHSIEVVYFAQFQGSLNGIKINPEDHSEYKWVSENELPGIAGLISPEEYRNVEKGFKLLHGDVHDFGNGSLAA